MKHKHRPCPCGCGELADECMKPSIGLNAFRIASDLNALRFPEAFDEEREDVDPTDVETGGLAASWAESRATVKAHPTYTDGLD